MENRFHGLPPLKRFTLLHHQQQQRQEEDSLISSHLPAKKRKQSQCNPLPTTTTYCLPAKKRVWAPESISLSPRKPVSPFDLNVEYKPSPQKEEPKKKNRELNKRIEHGQQDGGQENLDDDDGIVCDICQSTDGDPSDPIVLCDGCDLMVHSTCYGNPLIRGIPEGDWFCSRCEASPSSRQNDNLGYDCCLCPVKGGAMKPTKEGRWAHVLCALLVPEVFFRDPKGREGIDCSSVPCWRWKEVCYVCDTASGCAIECSEPKCSLAFHVSCGLKEDFCFEYREGKAKETIVAGFCKSHTELWEKQRQSGKFRIVAREKLKK